MLAVAYALTWGLATLSYNTIEEPFLRMRRRYGAEKTGQLGVSVVPDLAGRLGGDPG
jgi:peptidoglycan/LPS O-acetylase OafA/YrhL